MNTVYSDGEAAIRSMSKLGDVIDSRVSIIIRRTIVQSLPHLFPRVPVLDFFFLFELSRSVGRTFWSNDRLRFSPSNDRQRNRNTAAAAKLFKRRRTRRRISTITWLGTSLRKPKSRRRALMDRTNRWPRVTRAWLRTSLRFSGRLKHANWKKWR